MEHTVKKGLGYQSTIKACFIGYIVQAIVNNFAPLLFLVFQSEYGIPLSKFTWRTACLRWGWFRWQFCPEYCQMHLPVC